MKKKLQIFISSTFTDLLEERQAAVQAILNAGHIPAGMELFTPGDESQQEIIKEWIEESDAYMLILGGRYGSLLPNGEKSYTHWEYDYAQEIGKPRFALVLTEKSLDEKVAKIGRQKALEENSPQMYKEFKNSLLKDKLVCRIDDLKDIENSIFKCLRKVEQNNNLSGWVSGKEIPDNSKIIETNFELQVENEKLKKEIEELKLKLSSTQDITFSGFTYEVVSNALQQKIVTVPDQDTGTYEKKDILSLFKATIKIFSTGVTIKTNKNDVATIFIYHELVPSLMTYGLLEIIDNKLFVSKSGFKFLARYEQELLQTKKGKRSTQSTK